ncbi:hypothetical protein OSB04_006157 [Centaurea solstitialis]|uniref:Uncharacterized protein n=1 Tax=Centaurea solstitialis TaxID=347529 RepID=A0AA38U0I0_9ASTR|nr:hypothetical protein OSB04_006157 [Centaurea solstitialis]
MASRTFLFLALAFSVLLLVTSEVAAAKDLASNPDSQINGHGGHDNDGDGGHDNDGDCGHDNDDHHHHHFRHHHHHHHGGGRHHGGCGFGCCGGRDHGGCKCCSSFEEATAYKQTQN